jgi:phenylpyruvate tautomerase PptA (4-oxalocrotonate tautomerase family)
MPLFNVTVPEGRLSSEQKTKVAVALGGTYKELTGGARESHPSDLH